MRKASVIAKSQTKGRGISFLESSNLNREGCATADEYGFAVGAIDRIGELGRDDVFGISPPEISWDLTDD
jgi:hypothetical protein